MKYNIKEQICNPNAVRHSSAPLKGAASCRLFCEMLWRQFGAAIDMLGDALRDCPDDLWEKILWEDQPDQWEAAGFSAFWYLGYHTLFWLDLYLTGAEEGFAPPAPFDLVEMDAGEVLPRTYTREELLGYLEYCRRKCQETIGALSHEQAYRLCRFA